MPSGLCLLSYRQEAEETGFLELEMARVLPSLCKKASRWLQDHLGLRNGGQR